MTSRLLALLVACLLLAALPATAQAQTTPPPVTIGLSDQNPATFVDPLFAPLGIKQVRLVTPWNAIYTDRARLDLWIRNATAAGAKILVSFEHSANSRCPDQPCSLPSMMQYGDAFRAFRARYPQIKQISPWNEANHVTQPTVRNAAQAAWYFNLVKIICPKCTIVAADVLDSPNMARWLKTFLRYADRPTIFGLHNYSDTNRFRTKGTKTLLQTVPGTVWLTETGAVVSFVTSKGVDALPFDEQRAAKSMRFLFDTLVPSDLQRIRRAYIYNWRSDPKNRFDSGLIRADGTPRQTYDIVRQYNQRLRAQKAKRAAARRR